MTPKKPSPFGPRGAWLAAALNLTLPAAAEPPLDPSPTTEARVPGQSIQIQIYGSAPQQLVLAVPPAVIPATMLNGTWSGSGSDGDRMGWSLTYTIRDGRYTLEGYPPLSEAGDVALAALPVEDASGEATVLVRFSGRVMNGSPVEDRTEAWVLSADQQRFTRPIDMTFTRTTTTPAPPTQDSSP
jgi:hypothetical protein